MRSPEKVVQVSCVEAALELQLCHAQRRQLVTAGTPTHRKWFICVHYHQGKDLRVGLDVHGPNPDWQVALRVRFMEIISINGLKAVILMLSFWVCVCLKALPAADRSSCVRLPRPAAAVRPRPLVAVPGHAQAAVDREWVADLFTCVVAFRGLLKVSVQQSHVSNPCSYALVLYRRPIKEK